MTDFDLQQKNMWVIIYKTALSRHDAACFADSLDSTLGILPAGGSR